MKNTPIILMLVICMPLITSMQCNTGDYLSLKLENKCEEPILVINNCGHDFILQPNYFDSWPYYWIDTIPEREEIETIGYIDGELDPDFIVNLIVLKQSTVDKYGKTTILDKNIYDKSYTVKYKEVIAGLDRIVYSGD